MTPATIKKILETPFWLDSLQSQKSYTRLHDDHDGTKLGRLAVYFSEDGDAWVGTDTLPLRFRDHLGGGVSPRVRNALIILAEAIRLDNAKHDPLQMPLAFSESPSNTNGNHLSPSGTSPLLGKEPGDSTGLPLADLRMATATETPCVFCRKPGATEKAFNLDGLLCGDCYIDEIKLG